MPRATVGKVESAEVFIQIKVDGEVRAAGNSIATKEVNETLSALWDVAIPALKEIGGRSCQFGDCQIKELRADWCESCIANQTLREMGVE